MNALLISLILKFLVINICTLVYSSSSSSSVPYEVLYSWKYIDYNFPSAETRHRLLQTGGYIPENNIPAGIKIYGSRLYLSVLRLRPGVPSTLNYINLNNLSSSTTTNKSPLLTPYPSWQMQEIGNCNALQFVQSMEVDRWGRMWIIDIGRDNILPRGQNRTTPVCPAKLLLIDLTTNKILHRHIFPVSVVNPKTNFLNDIVVECKYDSWSCWAYISDTWDSKLVMYSLAQDKSWFVQHAASMEANAQASTINILGNNFPVNSSINGIALSGRRISNHDRLYYCPLSSYSIYSVLTSALKNAFKKGQRQLMDADIEYLAKHRGSQSGGIMADATGLLFTGQLARNAVSYISTAVRGCNQNQEGCESVLIQNDTELQWPDTFAFDMHGYLYLTSVKMHRFYTNTLDFSEENFRVVRIYVGSRSYMY